MSSKVASSFRTRSSSRAGLSSTGYRTEIRLYSRLVLMPGHHKKARNRWVQTWQRNGPRVSTLRRYSRSPRLGAFLTSQIPQCGQAGIWTVLVSPAAGYEQDRAELRTIGREVPLVWQMELAKAMMVENGRRLYRDENCGAGGGDRTRTPLSGHGILSPGRLPIPPPRLCWGKTRACCCASTTVSSTPSNRTGWMNEFYGGGQIGDCAAAAGATSQNFCRCASLPFRPWYISSSASRSYSGISGLSHFFMKY